MKRHHRSDTDDVRIEIHVNQHLGHLLHVEYFTETALTVANAITDKMAVLNMVLQLTARCMK